nr:MAG TPA: hypothetical protein [Caudoviricetes sp.]
MKTKKIRDKNLQNTLAPPPTPPPERTAGGSNHQMRCPIHRDFG